MRIPMMNNDITLCLIVKNEAHCLESCIKSVQKICSHIIIADTGSTDGSQAIASKYTSEVFDYYFSGNFAAARNAVLDRVQTEWILFLDADEEMLPTDARQLPAILETVAENVWGLRLLRYNIFANGGWYSQHEMKMFRNRPKVRYTKFVSETVIPSILQEGRSISNIPIILNHFGHCEPACSRAAKLEYYIDLTHKQLQETPDDALLHGNIGLMLRSLGNVEEALQWSSRALEIDPDSAVLYGIHGHVLRSSGYHEEALVSYRKATELSPYSAALWHMVGVIELILNHLEEAQDALNYVLELNSGLIHVKINLGLIAQARGEYDQAIQLFEEAATRNPAFLHEEWNGRTEYDPYRSFQYETIMNYAGLAYHLAYCRSQLLSSSHTYLDWINEKLLQEV